MVTGRGTDRYDITPGGLGAVRSKKKQNVIIYMIGTLGTIPWFCKDRGFPMTPLAIARRYTQQFAILYNIGSGMLMELHFQLFAAEHEQQ